MRKSLAALLALLLVCPLAARAATAPHSMTLPLVVNYDLDSTSYVYCKSVGVGAGQNADFNWKDQAQPVTTGGSSSATLAAVTAATNGPYDNLAVGSLLWFNIASADAPTAGATPTFRYLTAKASDDSATIDSVVTVAAAGVGFQYLNRSCGTSASSGWFSVSGWTAGTALLEISQIVTTSGIDYQLECKHAYPWATAVAVLTNTAAVTAAGTVPLVWSEPYDYCRVGIKLDSTDDGNDLTTNTEQIFITVVGRK